MPVIQTSQTRTWEVPLAEVIAGLGVTLPAGDASYNLQNRGGDEGFVLVVTVDEPVA